MATTDRKADSSLYLRMPVGLNFFGHHRSGRAFLKHRGMTCQETATTSTATGLPAPKTVTGTGIYVHNPIMLQDPLTHYYWLYGTHQTIAYSTDGTTSTHTTKSTPDGAVRL